MFYCYQILCFSSSDYLNAHKLCLFIITVALLNVQIQLHSALICKFSFFDWIASASSALSPRGNLTFISLIWTNELMVELNVDACYLIIRSRLSLDLTERNMYNIYLLLRFDEFWVVIK